MTPSVPPETQTPSTLGRLGSWAEVTRWAVAESHMPLYSPTSLMPGLAAKTSLAPLLRSLSAPVPATPVTMTTLP